MTKYILESMKHDNNHDIGVLSLFLIFKTMKHESSI